MASTSEIQSTSSTSVIVEDNTKHVTASTSTNIRNIIRSFTLIIERNDDEIKKITKNKDAISITDKDGNNALHLAASTDDIRVFTVLYEAGLDLVSKNNNGDTPLHVAAEKWSTNVLSFILKKIPDVDIDAKNKYDRTPLFSAVKSGFRKGVEKLVHAGANINFCDKNGLAPLFCAACDADECMPGLLVSLGAKVQIRGKNNRTLLHRAAKAASEDCIKFFIAHGVNVHDVDDFGNTALHTAIEYYNNHDKQFIYETITVLIAAGVDPNIKNKNGETATCIAMKKNNRSACNAITQICNVISTVNTLPEVLKDTRKRYTMYAESQRIEQECKRKRRLC